MALKRNDRKAQRRKEAQERLAASTKFSDSRYKCNHFHTSPLQFQRCMPNSGPREF